MIIIIIIIIMVLHSNMGVTAERSLQQRRDF